MWVASLRNCRHWERERIPSHAPWRARSNRPVQVPKWLAVTSLVHGAAMRRSEWTSDRGTDPPAESAGCVAGPRTGAGTALVSCDAPHVLWPAVPWCGATHETPTWRRAPLVSSGTHAAWRARAGAHQAHKDTRPTQGWAPSGARVAALSLVCFTRSEE